GLGDLNLFNVSSSASAGPLDVTACGNLTVLARATIDTAAGTLSLAACGNLAVLAGATIDTGTGTLSLAADTKADGTGNDGVGILSIGAGALVTSANHITLRGADIQIDTSANPAVVRAQQRFLTVAPTAVLTGVSY